MKKPQKANQMLSWQVYLDPRGWGRGHNLYFNRYNEAHGTREVITGFEVESFDYAHMEPETAGLFMDNIQLQAFMDILWSAGFRPTEGTGSAGSLRATQEHLATVQSVMNRTLTLIEKKWDQS